ncbi:MAG: hypothetical protein ACQSGP_05135 [Frankia sp.]
MITLGLVLLLLAGGLVADVVVENGQHLDVTILHQKLTVDSWAFFVAGIATALVAMIAFWLLAKGAARDSRRRREHRELLKEAQANAAMRERAREKSVTGKSPATAETAPSATAAPVAPAESRSGRVTTWPAPAAAGSATRVQPVSTTRPTVEMGKPEARTPRGAGTRTPAAPAADATDPGATAARPVDGPSAATVTDDRTADENASRTGVFARLRR